MVYNFLNNKLSNTEYQILCLLWDEKHNLTSKEICDYFSLTGKKWKIQTVNTYLTRMLKKGVVKVDDSNKNFYYTATISKLQYDEFLAKDFLNEKYDGSISKFITAFTGENNKLTKKESDEIRKLLE